MKQKKVNLNIGEYVFCSIKVINKNNFNNIICYFKESKGYSIIISKVQKEKFMNKKLLNGEKMLI